jgi:hypothetical protein
MPLIHKCALAALVVLTLAAAPPGGTVVTDPKTEDIDWLMGNC